MCGNYSREETIQRRKLFEEIRYSYHSFVNCALNLCKWTIHVLILTKIDKISRCNVLHALTDLERPECTTQVGFTFHVCNLIWKEKQPTQSSGLKKYNLGTPLSILHSNSTLINLKSEPLNISEIPHNGRNSKFIGPDLHIVKVLEA